MKRILTGVCLFLGLFLGGAAIALLSWRTLGVGGGVGCITFGGIGASAVWRRRREETVIGRMHVRLCAMLATLRRHAGRSALRQPWYIVMGPESAGKSRLLDAGELCVYATATAQPAPETHARLLATASGLMVDAPGRLMHPGHAREWRAWLKTLCFRLGRKRLAGVVVAVDVQRLRQPELLTPSLRQALTTLLHVSRKRLPIHIVITQTDELVGFTPTFLEAGELTQSAWGFSLDDTSEVALATGQRMAELIERLTRYSVAQLGLGADSSARARRYMFPQSLGTLERPLVRLVEEIFGTQTSEATLRLAGIYWTAVPQGATKPNPQGAASLASRQRALAARPDGSLEALPLPGWAAALAPAATEFPVSSMPVGDAPVPTHAASARGFFVAGLFARVLPHHAAGDTRLWRPGFVGLWWAAPGTCFLALAISAGLVSVLTAFVHHSALMDRVHRAVMPLTVAADDTALEQALEDLGALSTELLAYHAHGLPWHLHLGQGSVAQALMPVARLTTTLGQGMLLAADATATQRCFDVNWQQLGFVSDAPGEASRAELLSRLHSYLLLTAPKERGEPSLADVRESAWLRKSWLERLGVAEVEPSEQAVVAKHIDRQLALLAQLPELSSIRQPEVILRVRSLLQRRPLPDLLVDGMVHDSRRLGPDVDAEQLHPGSHKVLGSRHSVPIGMSRLGYAEVARPSLTGVTGGGSAWLLGPRSLSTAVQKSQAHQTRALYHARYVAHWEAFLDGLKWHELGTLWSAQRLLDDMTEGEPKLLPGLLRAVAHQVALGDSEKEPASQSLSHRLFARLGPLSGSAADSRSPGGSMAASQGIETAGDVQAAFAPLRDFVEVRAGKPAPIDQFQDSLVALKTSLAAYLEAPRGAEPLLEQLRQTRLLARHLLAQVPSGSGMRPRLSRLMIEPLDGLTRAFARGVRSQSDAAWGPQVVQVFRPLSRRYPFHPQGLDAPLTEVLHFFRPSNGELWGYYRSELSEDIIAVARGFAFDGRMGGVVRHTYHPSVLPYLTQARAVTQALYPSGDGSEAGCEVEVRLLGAAGTRAVSLSYDGQALALARGEHTSAWQRWHWPPRDLGSAGTELLASDDSGAEASWRHEGVWALWRLLESGQARIDREVNGLTVHWPLGGHGSAVQLELRPLRRDHPFFQAQGGGLFGVLRDPRIHPPLHLSATKS